MIASGPPEANDEGSDDRNDDRNDDRTNDSSERALTIIEIVGALVACGIIATAPVWLALLVAELFDAPPILVGVVTAAIVLALPAVLRTRRTRHLNAYERWGTHLALALRLPLDLPRMIAKRRTARALGSASTPTAVKALDTTAPTARDVDAAREVGAARSSRTDVL